MQPDYVVVGAGSGGCVLTRHLLDRGARVLLLEAGPPDRHLFISAPATFSRLFRTKYDWAFETVPQAHLDGRRLFWPRGRVLGGSSAINATIYIRGSRQDFDGWDGTPGWGPGWTWADVLPAYRALERFQGEESGTRGTAGPLHVGHRAASHPLSHAFVEAAATVLGVPAGASFNDGTHHGSGLYESNHRRGVRHSAFRAFLAPVLGHKGLTVLPNAQVLELLWAGTRVCGVRFRWGARTLEAPAGGVVLCAGAVQTPQLLLRCGVGPRAELARHGVPVRAHVPGVGENLQDHLAVPVIFHAKVPSLDTVREGPALARWVLGGRGPLSSNVAEAGAYAHARPGLDRHGPPDLQYHFGPAYFRDHGFTKVATDHFSIGPVLVDVHSRGRVTLATTDPDAPPNIDPNYLADERDVRSLLAGVRLAREMAAASSLAALNGGERLPGPDVQDDATVLQYVRQEAATLYHPVGTAALGDRDDAVVDRRLAVRGTQGLWVADASVMPRIIHANTNATAMMIGARAADFLG